MPHINNFANIIRKCENNMLLRSVWLSKQKRSEFIYTCVNDVVFNNMLIRCRIRIICPSII